MGYIPVEIGDLEDVDTDTNPPVLGSRLTWNGSAWVPDEPSVDNLVIDDNLEFVIDDDLAAAEQET